MSVSLKFSRLIPPLVNFPLGYWLVSRMNFRRFSGWLIKEYSFWILSGIILSQVPIWEAFYRITVSWLTLMMFYEIGYWQNDSVSHKEKVGALSRLGFKDVHPPIFVILRLFLFTVLAAFLFTIDGIIVIFTIILTFFVFLIHNNISPTYRLATYILLKTLYCTVPILSLAPYLYESKVCYLFYIFIIFIFEIGPRGWDYALIKLDKAARGENTTAMEIWPLAMFPPCCLIGIMVQSWQFLLLAIYQVGVRILLILIRKFW